MGNNLPQKYNDSIFYKIKNFFLRLFGNKSDNLDEKVSNINNLNNNVNNNAEIIKPKEIGKNSISVMREENEKNREKEELLNQIEENTDLINNWSVERLLKLEKVYDEKIAQYDNEIAKLKGQEA